MSSSPNHALSSTSCSNHRHHNQDYHSNGKQKSGQVETAADSIGHSAVSTRAGTGSSSATCTVSHSRSKEMTMNNDCIHYDYDDQKEANDDDEMREGNHHHHHTDERKECQAKKGNRCQHHCNHSQSNQIFDQLNGRCAPNQEQRNQLLTKSSLEINHDQFNREKYQFNREKYQFNQDHIKVPKSKAKEKMERRKMLSSSSFSCSNLTTTNEDDGDYDTDHNSSRRGSNLVPSNRRKKRPAPPPPLMSGSSSATSSSATSSSAVRVGSNLSPSKSSTGLIVTRQSSVPSPVTSSPPLESALPYNKKPTRSNSVVTLTNENCCCCHVCDRNHEKVDHGVEGSENVGHEVGTVCTGHGYNHGHESDDPMSDSYRSPSVASSSGFSSRVSSSGGTTTSSDLINMANQSSQDVRKRIQSKGSKVQESSDERKSIPCYHHSISANYVSTTNYNSLSNQEKVGLSKSTNALNYVRSKKRKAPQPPVQSGTDQLEKSQLVEKSVISIKAKSAPSLATNDENHQKMRDRKVTGDDPSRSVIDTTDVKLSVNEEEEENLMAMKVIPSDTDPAQDVNTKKNEERTTKDGKESEKKEVKQVIIHLNGSQPIDGSDYESKNEISRSEISRNEISRNEISRNEISKNEISKNEISKNEISKNEISKKDDSNRRNSIEQKVDEIQMNESQSVVINCSLTSPVSQVVPIVSRSGPGDWNDQTKSSFQQLDGEKEELINNQVIDQLTCVGASDQLTNGIRQLGDSNQVRNQTSEGTESAGENEQDEEEGEASSLVHAVPMMVYFSPANSITGENPNDNHYQMFDSLKSNSSIRTFDLNHRSNDQYGLTDQPDSNDHKFETMRNHPGMIESPIQDGDQSLTELSINDHSLITDQSRSTDKNDNSSTGDTTGTMVSMSESSSSNEEGMSSMFIRESSSESEERITYLSSGTVCKVKDTTPKNIGLIQYNLDMRKKVKLGQELSVGSINGSTSNKNGQSNTGANRVRPKTLANFTISSYYDKNSDSLNESYSSLKMSSPKYNQINEPFSYNTPKYNSLNYNNQKKHVSLLRINDNEKSKETGESNDTSIKQPTVTQSSVTAPVNGNNTNPFVSGIRQLGQVTSIQQKAKESTSDLETRRFSLQEELTLKVRPLLKPKPTLEAKLSKPTLEAKLSSGSSTSSCSLRDFALSTFEERGESLIQENGERRKETSAQDFESKSGSRISSKSESGSESPRSGGSGTSSKRQQTGNLCPPPPPPPPPSLFADPIIPHVNTSERKEKPEKWSEVDGQKRQEIQKISEKVKVEETGRTQVAGKISSVGNGSGPKDAHHALNNSLTLRSRLLEEIKGFRKPPVMRSISTTSTGHASLDLSSSGHSSSDGQSLTGPSFAIDHTAGHLSLPPVPTCNPLKKVSIVTATTAYI